VPYKQYSSTDHSITHLHLSPLLKDFMYSTIKKAEQVMSQYTDIP